MFGLASPLRVAVKGSSAIGKTQDTAIGLSHSAIIGALLQF